MLAPHKPILVQLYTYIIFLFITLIKIFQCPRHWHTVRPFVEAPVSVLSYSSYVFLSYSNINIKRTKTWPQASCPDGLTWDTLSHSAPQSQGSLNTPLSSVSRLNLRLSFCDQGPAVSLPPLHLLPSLLSPRVSRRCRCNIAFRSPGTLGLFHMSANSPPIKL